MNEFASDGLWGKVCLIGNDDSEKEKNKKKAQGNNVFILKKKQPILFLKQPGWL